MFLAVSVAEATGSVFAQKNGTQLWFDYDFNDHFTEQLLFKAEASYKTVLSRTEKWRSFGLTPTVEYNIIPAVDLILETPLTYTFQTDTINTMELSVAGGARVYFSKSRRIDGRATVKFESRYFREVTENSWGTSNRLRIKPECRIALNKDGHSYDNLWYTTLEAEIFMIIDRDVSERYANRVRLNWGLGYRLSYRYRFEIVYLFQESRNKLQEDNEVSKDNIIRLRFKHYLKQK